MYGYEPSSGENIISDSLFHLKYKSSPPRQHQQLYISALSPRRQMRQLAKLLIQQSPYFISDTAMCTPKVQNNGAISAAVTMFRHFYISPLARILTKHYRYKAPGGNPYSRLSVRLTDIPVHQSAAQFHSPVRATLSAQHR